MKNSKLNIVVALTLLLSVFGANSLIAGNQYILDFDGSNDYVKYTDDATLGRMDGATDYTIEAWIYPNSSSVADYDYFINRWYTFKLEIWKVNTGAGTCDWWFGVSDDGSADNYSNYNTEGDATLTLNEWNHVAIINNSSEGWLKLYVNGVDVTTTGGYSNDALYGSVSSDNLYIGAKGTGSNSFGGYIDEVRLKNVAESPSNLHYNKTDQPYTSDSNTAGLFHFDEGSGTNTVNKASSSNATLNNGVIWRTWDYGSSDLSLPVELTYFRANSSSRGVSLSWETASEHENLGYIIERRIGDSKTEAEVASYRNVAALEGAGSSTKTSNYTWTDTDVASGLVYYYTLSDVDYQSKQTAHKTIAVSYVQPDQDLKPGHFEVKAIYPNPFNPSTTIDFTLSKKTRLSIAVYNSRGQQIMSLMDQQLLGPGNQSILWSADNVPAGVYFVNLRSVDQVLTQKVVKLN